MTKPMTDISKIKDKILGFQHAIYILEEAGHISAVEVLLKYLEELKLQQGGEK